MASLLQNILKAFSAFWNTYAKQKKTYAKKNTQFNNDVMPGTAQF